MYEDIKDMIRHFSSPPVYLRYYTAYKKVDVAKDEFHFVYGIIKDNGLSYYGEGTVLWAKSHDKKNCHVTTVKKA